MKKVVYLEGHEEDKLYINGKYYTGLYEMTMREIFIMLANENVLKLEIKEAE